tara:strand:+ start:4380 stop:4994 length:615 start_codon:yes stop_codon:yes gene_type:complete
MRKRRVKKWYETVDWRPSNYFDWYKRTENRRDHFLTASREWTAYEGEVRLFKGHPYGDTVITVIFFYTPAITGEAVKQASGVWPGVDSLPAYFGMIIPNHHTHPYNDYSPSPWIPSEVKATPRAYINYQHLNELMRTIVPNFGKKSGMWNYGGGDQFRTNRQYTYEEPYRDVFQSKDEFVKEVYQYIESVKSPRTLNYPMRGAL